MKQKMGLVSLVLAFVVACLVNGELRAQGFESIDVVPLPASGSNNLSPVGFDSTAGSVVLDNSRDICTTDGCVDLFSGGK